MTPGNIARAKVLYGRRIQLPIDVAERLKPELEDNVREIRVWLLVLERGRYRLLFERHLKEYEGLKTLLARAEEIVREDRSIEPFDAEPAETAALPARLVQTAMSEKGPPGPGWRLRLPKDLPPEPINEGESVFLVFSQGYLEVWSVERLAQAIRKPIGEILY